MKPPVQWMTAAALLFALALSSRAQEAPGLRIYLGPPPPKPMTLVPGLYVSAGEGAMAGQQEPRAFAMKVTRVDGNQFSGELEVIRLDGKGALVRLNSKLSGTIGSAGITSTPGKIVINSTPPLAIQLQDEPLRSSMAEVTGDMRANGLRLSWQTPVRQLGADKIGTHAAFVVASEDEYAQVVDRYKEMAEAKTRLMALQAASADFLQGQLKAYMQETDQLLQQPPTGDQGNVVAKAAALYKREKALLDGHPPSDEDAAPKEARLLVMQIDAYASQVAYINERQTEASRYWLGKGASVSQLVWYSPCVSPTSPTSFNYGASPACDGLTVAYDAVQKRMRAVTQALGNTRQPETSMGCLWQAAHQALRPSVLKIPDVCRQSLASLESGETK